MTSSEIIEKLLEMQDKEAIADLRSLFETADLVKFAKHNPLMNENDANLINAIEFINETKDYKLYDEQNRVVTTQKGTELYTHYDKVESSVRERYEKVQKQQKKTTQKKTVTTKKAR